MNRKQTIAALSLGIASLAGSAATLAAWHAPHPQPVSATPAVPEPPVESDRRTQYDLGQAIDAARTAATSSESALLERMRRDWVGRRYLWEAAYVPALCQRRERCFVAPFDHARADAPETAGWLLELDLSAETHRALRNACAARSGTCVVRVSGRLTKLVLQSELPTAAGLSDVDLAGSRPARPEESWIRRPER